MDNTRATASVPWWVRALDLLTLVLLLAGVGLAMWRGPRFSLGPWLVSIRSPWRLVVWGGVIALVRHVLFRRPSLPGGLWSAAGKAWAAASGAGRAVARWRPPSPRIAWKRAVTALRSPYLRAVVAPFLASRFAVLLVGALAVAAIGFPPDRERPRLAENSFVNLMARWDSEWYLSIAHEGYQWDEDLRHRARLAFLPAFPLASRAAGWLTGSAASGAALVVLGAFLLALVYLFRLARETLGDDAADAAVLFLAFSPFAVFYSALYTESLFLLAAVGAFYHLRRGEWVRASAWGVVAGLARPNGFLLAIALAILCLERVLRDRKSARNGDLHGPRLLAGATAASMPLVGIGLYSVFVYRLTGDPLTWLRLHEFWGRGQGNVWTLVTTRFESMRSLGFVGFAGAAPIDFVNTMAAVLALAAIWPVSRRLGLSYGAFVAVNVAAALLSGTTLSMARMTATLFPLFLWLGVTVPARQRSSWIAAFAVAQGLFTVLFFTWRRFY